MIAIAHELKTFIQNAEISWREIHRIILKGILPLVKMKTGYAFVKFIYRHIN